MTMAGLVAMVVVKGMAKLGVGLHDNGRWRGYNGSAVVNGWVWRNDLGIEVIQNCNTKQSKKPLMIWIWDTGSMGDACAIRLTEVLAIVAQLSLLA